MSDDIVIQSDRFASDDPVVQSVVHIGGRREQQDALLVADRLVALSDGMGGHARGRDASREALLAMADAATAPLGPERLLAAAARADEAVRALSSGGGWREPGATLVAVAADGHGGVHGLWCGDSRAYLLDRDGTLLPLTADHAGPCGGIDHALGDHGGYGAKFDTFTVPVGCGHRVLLCSDGLTGPFETAAYNGVALSDGHDDPDDSDAAIAALLRDGLAALTTVAIEHARDNVTAALIDVDRFAHEGR